MADFASDVSYMFQVMKNLRDEELDETEEYSSEAGAGKCLSE